MDVEHVYRTPAHVSGAVANLAQNRHMCSRRARHMLTITTMFCSMPWYLAGCPLLMERCTPWLLVAGPSCMITHPALGSGTEGQGVRAWDQGMQCSAQSSSAYCYCSL